MNLTAQEQSAVKRGDPVTVTVAGVECILLRKDVYQQLDPDYDTEPWTAEEMNLLADEAEQIISESESHEDQSR